MHKLSPRFRLFLCFFGFLCFLGSLCIPACAQSSLAITTTSLPNGTQGVAYSQQMYATGGAAPYSWSYGVGGPPSGMALSSSGLLSGTPGGNTYPFSTMINVIVEDSQGNQSTENLPITINPAGNQSLAITTTSVPNGTQGVAYSQQLYVTGGTGPYTWSLGAQGPPSGMALSSSGVLSGTPSGNTYPDQAEINVIVTDSASHQATEILPLLINAATSQSLAIATTSVPNGTPGAAYSQQLVATGGTAPYTWSTGAQGPPSGIALSSTGLLSGTPGGNTYPYQAEINVIVTDSASHQATEVLPFLISPANSQPLAITTTSVPNGTQGAAYSQQLYATGGTPPYTWSLGAQGPPSGMALSSRGLLSGTPSGNTYPDQAEINVIVTDSANGTETEVLPLLINPASNQSVAITTTSVPNGTQGVAYSQQLYVTGGTAPYTWSIGGQGPPSGMSLSSTGLLSGSPSGNTYPDQAEINVIVTDSASHQASEVLPLLINAANGQPLAITTPSVPNGTQGVAYSQQLYATGGTAPYTWAIGAQGPPSGMAFSSSGVLSGTPSGNTYPYQAEINVIVTDSASHQATEVLPLLINAVGASLAIETASLPDGTQGVAYSQQLSATGGTGPYTWSTGTGGPPSGMALSSSGLLSGTPSGGTYPFSTTINVIVTDSASHQATANLPITIDAASGQSLTITTTSVPNGTQGMGYSEQLSATGGTAPYTWSTGTGQPPSGMSLSSSGLLSGTPSGNTYPYSTTINVIVTDSASHQATANFPITINPAAATIPASFIAVANYSTNQLVYTGDLAQFNTTWWLGGSQIANADPTELHMLTSGYHFLPTFNTGNVGVGQNFFTASGSGACVTTSTGCTANTSHMQQTVQLAYSEIGAGGYYSIGNEEDNSSSDDVAPAVYVPQFQAWVNVIKGVDPTAHIVGPNQEQWSCCDSTTSNPWGTAGAWFQAFVTAYEQAYGVKPPIDVLSEHLYNTNAATSAPSDDFTTAYDARMVSDVQNFRNYANSVGYTATPIWITEFGFNHKLQVGPQTPEQNAQTARVVEDLAAGASSLGLQRIFWYTDNSQLIIDDGLDPLFNPTAASNPNSPMPSSDLGQLASNLAHNQLPLITTPSLATANTGVAYSQQMVATGGNAPYTWTAQSLPSGISLSSSGLLAGTPSGNSSAEIEVTVTDSADNAGTESLLLPIDVLTIGTTSVPNATQGSAYSQQLVATGGTAPYIWTYLSNPPATLPGGVGPLPNGISLSSTGLLSGTPSGNTLYPDAAEFWIAVVVTDNAGNTANEILPLLLDASGIPQFAITTASLPAGTVDQPYSQQLAAAGGYIETSHAYTWSYGTQALPAGLTMSSTGLLSGTPTSAGQTSINVIAYDDVTNQASKTFTLTIGSGNNQSLAITTTSVPTATQGMSYSQTLNATGGTGSYTWTAQGLPGGLSVSSDGVLFGTPSGDAYPETATINVAVSDGNTTASEALSLTINAMGGGGGGGNTSYPASFIAIANYGAFDANHQNVYAGDLNNFNTTWWLGGSQVETADQNQLNMLKNGYHFAPFFDTGATAVYDTNFYVQTSGDPDSCITTACGSYNDGALSPPTQSLPCGPESVGNSMRYTACLAANEAGPGGYYGIGNEEDATGSGFTSPTVYVSEFTEWANLIRQYDSTAHFVGPNMTAWDDGGLGTSCGLYPYGRGGDWFQEFVTAYKAANNGALPPLSAISMHLYNLDPTQCSDVDSDTEADNFVTEVTNFRNAANADGFSASIPIWITELGFAYNPATDPYTPDQKAQITRVLNGLAAVSSSENLQRLFLFTDGDYGSQGLDPLYDPSSLSGPNSSMLLSDYGQLVHNLAFQP